MNNFNDLKVNEVYFFYEFSKELIVEEYDELVFCDQFWLELYATKLVDEFKADEKTFPELVLEIEPPPPRVTSGDWWKILNTFWNYK